jgi:hypothetical protein
VGQRRLQDGRAILSGDFSRNPINIPFMKACGVDSSQRS